MKRNLLVIFILLLFGISANAQKECNGGNHNPPKDNDHPYVPGPGTTTSGGASVDPNEIIGPTGFGDSIRWVSINDILNYTILFENDPEFATANAQRVDVRFDFGQKELMKDFTLGTFGFVFFL